VATVRVVRQHTGVAGRTPLRTLALCAFLGSAVAVGVGCDASVVSVGAWERSAPSDPGGTGGAGGFGGQVIEGGEPGAGGVPEQLGPGLYLEAESGELLNDPTLQDGGFVVISDSTASNDQYILPPGSLASDTLPGSAQVRYSFDLDQDGSYVLWGRIYTPDIASNRIWFQVDGGAWYKWRITVGTIWYWHFFHSDQQYDTRLHFMLSAGRHELLIANDVPGFRLDKLYITADDDTPPGNTTKCRPPHTIDRGAADCEPSCGVQAEPNMPTTCQCGAGSTTFYAYDCTSKVCCFTQ
jgi:hypothetical protein